MAATARPARPGNDSEWVHRFGPTERFGHWWTVAMLAIATLAGLAMGDDPSGPLLVVHIAAVVALVVGAITILVFGDRRSLGRAAGELLRLDRRDRRWLAGSMRHPVHRHAAPQWGMYNAGQKLMAWALIGSITGLIGSGLYALFNEGAGGLHAAFAVLTGVLVGAHVFMAVINPSTRHALNGMIHGRVRRSWAAQHHPRWLSSTGR